MRINVFVLTSGIGFDSSREVAERHFTVYV